MGRAIINTGSAKLVPRDRAFGAFWTAKPNGGIPDAVISLGKQFKRSSAGRNDPEKRLQPFRMERPTAGWPCGPNFEIDGFGRRSDSAVDLSGGSLRRGGLSFVVSGGLRHRDFRYVIVRWGVLESG